MPKTKKLGDLFVRGAEVTVEDGEDSVTVWVQKLNPLQQEKCLRRANGARAKILSVRKLPDDDLDKLSYYYEADELVQDRDAMLDYLLGEKLATAYQLREAELSAQEEWSEDNYLQGLNDAWQDGLKEEFVRDNDDPEAKRVFDELKRFANLVEAEVEKEREHMIREFDDKSDEDLKQMVYDQVIEAAADLEWLKEFRKSEIFFAVRHPDNHNKPYFDRREEVDDLEMEAFASLANAFQEIKVDVVEGKDSQGTQDS